METIKNQQKKRKYVIDMNIFFFFFNTNGNGIFICPLHIIIQYSAVLLPPPALISHCDQEKFTVKVFL